MTHAEIAKQLVELLGGKENVMSATHCATRLRLVIDDESKVNKEAIEKLDEVKGAFSTAGQFQVIFGTGTVNKVYAEFTKEIGMSQMDPSKHSEVAKRKMNPIARFARTLSNIFVPIIPAIVASGLLMGLLGMLNAFNIVDSGSSWFILLDMFSSAAFIILPILIGISASKEFGGNPYLGAVIGGIMTHPALLNPWGLGQVEPEYLDFLGLPVALIGYQGTVIPILLATYIMCWIEKRLRKVVPNSVDLLVVPFATVILTGFIAILAIGPLGLFLGDLLTETLNFIYNHGGFVAGIIFGGTYSLIVLTGVHHSFHAIEAGLIASIGINYLLPIWSMANIAQGGAGLAVFFKTKRAKTKEVALPSAVSAFLGITEPVIFGVNLRYRKPFIAALIGGAIGGGYVVFMNVAANAFGLTGIPMLAIIAPLGVSNIIHYLIGAVLALVIAFLLTLVLGFKEETE